MFWVWAISYLVVGSIISGFMVAFSDKLKGFTFVNPWADDFLIVFTALIWPIVVISTFVFLVVKLTISVVATLRHKFRKY